MAMLTSSGLFRGFCLGSCQCGQTVNFSHYNSCYPLHYQPLNCIVHIFKSTGMF